MESAPDIGLTREAFLPLAKTYWQAWRITLLATRADGGVVWGNLRLPRQAAVEFQEVCRLAIDESLRWGEPAIEVGPQGILVWAVPVMHNAVLRGGLVATIAERRIFPDGGTVPAVDLQRASMELRQLAEQHNVTNAALLTARRTEYQREQKRAEAIHAFKGDSGYKLRAMYLLDEPALIQAIRQADRGEARALVNRLLVRMIHHAGRRIDLVKSFFLELVVTLCRTAVEIGGAPEELLGVNFASMSELAKIRDDEALALWLHEILERIMDSIERTRPKDAATVVSGAWRYINDHCAEDISRDDAARAAGVSPAHFSRLIRSQLGKTFTEIMNEVRVGRAAELLARTNKPLKLVALEAGFKDQSYFTKVFHRYQQRTPRQYRLDRGES